MNYIPGTIPEKYGTASYSTTPREQAPLPTLNFFLRIMLGPMFRLWRAARKGRCDDSAWAIASCRAADIFEECGGRLEITGLDHIKQLQKPCIYIANHMSTLETFLLPGILRPFGPVTFVVKQSLAEMPLFGPIMRSRDPVIVQRKNPRADLETVLEEGTKRLAAGISMIVFPQHTRSVNLDEKSFNSIGIKLARKAKAPVIPLALKTDAWTNGRRIKELGRIRPQLPVHFKFGAPLTIANSGKDEHHAIYHFISENVAAWMACDGTSSSQD